MDYPRVYRMSHYAVEQLDNEVRDYIEKILAERNTALEALAALCKALPEVGPAVQCALSNEAVTLLVERNVRVVMHASIDGTPVTHLSRK